MKKILALMTGTATALTLAGCSSNAPAESGDQTSPSAATPSSAASSPASTDTTANDGTPITITAGNQKITATLNDTAVARDFEEMLPITLPWFRNAEIEYISELSGPLTETGPFYTDVQPGDIVYYNPRDSITIIYEETSSVPTLTKMGEITSDLEVFRNLPDDVDMRIEAG